MVIKNIDERIIAKRIIINALRIEESLADILRSEAKILKRKSNIVTSNEEIQKVNRTIKYILYFLTIIDDRILKSLDILKNHKDV